MRFSRRLLMSSIVMISLGTLHHLSLSVSDLLEPKETNSETTQFRILFSLPTESVRNVTERLFSAIGAANSSLKCSVTEQVQIFSNGTDWLLQSIDSRGLPKLVGGDEFHISYTDFGHSSTTAVAFVTDLENGKYRLRFIEPPMNKQYEPLTGSGVLAVHLQYTCGTGKMPPPSKNDWVTGGALHVNWTHHNASQPPIHPFVRPFGFNLTEYDHMAAYGDSLIGQFVGRYKKAFQEYPQLKGFPKRIWFRRNMRLPVENATVASVLSRLKDFHGGRIMQRNKTAIITGSALWDMLYPIVASHDETFEDHIQACREYIHGIREMFPETDIYWKSPSAVHVHVIPETPEAIQATRYLSNSRAQILYERQKKLCLELNVPFLDVFQATYLSADWLYPNDGRHYVQELNREMIQWFFFPVQQL